MLERVMTHAAGRFTKCRVCTGEPRHITASGRTRRETMHFTTAASRHLLECRCGARTARHVSLEEAESEWGAAYAQLALPLPAPVRAARRRNQQAAA